MPTTTHSRGGTMFAIIRVAGLRQNTFQTTSRERDTHTHQLTLYIYRCSLYTNRFWTGTVLVTAKFQPGFPSFWVHCTNNFWLVRKPIPSNYSSGTELHIWIDGFHLICHIFPSCHSFLQEYPDFGLTWISSCQFQVSNRGENLLPLGTIIKSTGRQTEPSTLGS